MPFSQKSLTSCLWKPDGIVLNTPRLSWKNSDSDYPENSVDVAIIRNKINPAYLELQ